MDDLLTIRLEAHHDDRNLHRHYRITVGRDLFNDWTVTICYGRSGRAGQLRRFGGADAADMHRVVRQHLVRRLSAPRRIGCGYQLTAIEQADGFDVGFWLPSEVLARFALREDQAYATLRSDAFIEANG